MPKPQVVKGLEDLYPQCGGTEPKSMSWVSPALPVHGGWVDVP